MRSSRSSGVDGQLGLRRAWPAATCTLALASASCLRSRRSSARASTGKACALALPGFRSFSRFGPRCASSSTAPLWPHRTRFGPAAARGPRWHRRQLLLAFQFLLGELQPGLGSANQERQVLHLGVRFSPVPLRLRPARPPVGQGARTTLRAAVNADSAASQLRLAQADRGLGFVAGEPGSASTSWASGWPASTAWPSTTSNFSTTPSTRADAITAVGRGSIQPAA